MQFFLGSLLNEIVLVLNFIMQNSRSLKEVFDCVIGALDSKRVLNKANMSFMECVVVAIFLGSLLNEIVLVLNFYFTRGDCD